MLRPVVRGFLLRRLRQAREAEAFADDATQEALLRIAERLSQCRATSERQVLAWSLTVAQHAAIDLLRTGGTARAQRWRALDSAHTAELTALTTPESPEPYADELVTPGERVLIDSLFDVYDRSPEPTAYLFWLYLIEGASWADVGAALGTTAAGAKRQYQRARHAIRAAVLDRIAALPPSRRAAAEEALRAFTGQLERWG